MFLILLITRTILIAWVVGIIGISWHHDRYRLIRFYYIIFRPFTRHIVEIFRSVTTRNLRIPIWKKYVANFEQSISCICLQLPHNRFLIIIDVKKQVMPRDCIVIRKTGLWFLFLFISCSSNTNRVSPKSWISDTQITQLY